MNNEVKELQIEEKKEIEKILENLSSMCLPYTKVLESNQDILANLDFIFSKAKLSSKLNASEPEFNNDY